MAPYRLLMVDDEIELGKLICRVAEDMGFSARATANARDFLAAMEEQAPDLVILDLGLPETDGVELMRVLGERGVQAEVLIMSGSDTRVRHSANRLGEARGLRMAGQIPKPVRIAELRAILSGVIDRLAAR